jgi:hypothetical protein
MGLLVFEDIVKGRRLFGFASGKAWDDIMVSEAARQKAER